MGVDLHKIWELHKKHNELVNNRYENEAEAYAKTNFSADAMMGALKYLGRISHTDARLLKTYGNRNVMIFPNIARKNWGECQDNSRYGLLIQQIKSFNQGFEIRRFQEHVGSPFSIINAVAKWYPCENQKC